MASRQLIRDFNDLPDRPVAGGRCGRGPAEDWSQGDVSDEGHLFGASIASVLLSCSHAMCRLAGFSGMDTTSNTMSEVLGERR
jgi:hypothetical protein